MISQFIEIVRATKVFLFVRAVVAFSISVIYILVAAAIQYYYVQLFGESTFNYIVGGMLSLIAGIAICGTLGKLVFMFVRGWHVGAIVYSKAIIERKLPALEVGMAVFQKHLSSFAVVYSIGVLLKKFTSGASDKVWELMEDVPFVSSLKKVAEWPVVRRLGADLLDTSFDCVVYYMAKYTAKGASDDLTKIPDALRKYLYALPKLAGTSVAWFFLSWVIPKVARVLLCLYVFTGGIVSGILLNVLLFPLFYFLTAVVFEPIRTALFLSAFTEQCEEEPVADCPYKTIVEGLMEALGLEGVFAKSDEDEAEEDNEPAQTKKSPKPKATVVEPDEEVEVAPVFEEDDGDEDDFIADILKSSATNAGTMPDLSGVQHSVDDGFAPEKKSTKPFTVPIKQLLDEDTEEQGKPTIASLSSLLSQSFGGSDMSALMDAMDAEGDSMDNLDDNL